MRYDNAMVDRQVGRNAELFSQAVAEIDTAEERYPYMRILVSLVEQAHPEWRQAPNKVDQMVQLIDMMCNGTLDKEEVADVIQMRDKERGRHRG